jgi:hypothetical protein
VSQLVSYVEIDIPSFNSPPTLVTYRFALDTSYLPSNIDCIPSIKSIDISPAIISLGENLGQRASATIVFKDHRHIFLTEDFSSGTFWGKFRARYGLKLQGYDLRIIRGTSDQPLANMETRWFVIESTDGPSAKGEFKIVAKDPLKLADGDRATAPIANNGFTSSTLTNSVTSLTLSPSGIGSEYAASGWANIGGKEIVSFTRASDVLTITRGQYNTAAVAHEANERVQQCAVWVTQNPGQIISDLLLTYAGIYGGWVPTATWLTECSTYLGVSYSANVAEPTSVATLISELIEQAGLAMWFDNQTQLINLQVLRPIPSTAQLFDQTRYLADSLQIKEQPEKRLSQVYTYFAKINPLINQDQINNYKSFVYSIDATSEAAYNGIAAIKTIFSRWIPDGGRSIATTLNGVLLARFKDPPRRVSFDLLRSLPDVTVNPTLGVGYQVQGWPIQDTTGAAATISGQITRLNPKADVFEVEMEELSNAAFAGATSPDVHTLIIDSNGSNINLRTLHDSVYGTPLSGQTINITLATGIVVGSSSTTLPAIDTGTWPGGVTVRFTVNGRIQGAGGNGGFGRSLVFAAGTGTAGNNGGIALQVSNAITLIDAAGAIWGGGGGGGGSTSPSGGSGCGGGGSGTIGGTHGGGDALTAHGSDGTATTGGGGGAPASGYTGGSGGNPGSNGNASFTGEGGGSAGASINGIASVTTSGGAGDRRGPQV